MAGAVAGGWRSSHLATAGLVAQPPWASLHHPVGLEESGPLNLAP